MCGGFPYLSDFIKVHPNHSIKTQLHDYRDGCLAENYLNRRRSS
jgi:hypothetical protein